MANLNDESLAEVLQRGSIEPLINTIRNILQPGAQVDITNSDRLLRAVRTGQLENVRELIEGGESPDSRGPNGETLLHIAACKGFQPIVEYLVQSGASLDARDNNGRTILHIAAYLDIGSIIDRTFDDIRYGGQNVMDILSSITEPDFRTTIEYLIRSGLPVDARDNSDWTPLHWAAYNDKVQIVQVLLNNGADPTIRTNDGRTAEDLAREKGYNSIIELLQSLLDIKEPGTE